VTTPLLHLDAITRRFGAVTALHPITLRIPVGARHAIIGPNGAGKTTLISLIAGTLRPSSGQVLLAGRNISRANLDRRARWGIGRTWQHPAVYPDLSVAANLAVAANRGRPSEIRRPRRRRMLLAERCHRLLEDIGLAAEASTLVAHLPYGHQRLLELAMVLAPRPRLLLLDEPSAGLDADERHRLIDQLRALPRDITLLIVDHHLDLVWALADAVTVLDQGREIITAPPTGVRADARVRQVYLAATTATPAMRSAGIALGPPVLRAQHLHTGYAGAPVLRDVSLEVAEGEVLAVLGRNGAGKTTLLNTLAGMHPHWPPTAVRVAGIPLRTGQAEQAARAGISIVPQGRRLFAGLTVAEHLRLAAATARRGPGRRWSTDDVDALLPNLVPRRHHRTTQLSGGEQQMLALARALLTNPRVLLLDEPSEGLAPALITALADALGTVAAEGVAIILAEQHRHLGMRLADRVIVLHDGVIALDHPVAALGDDQHRRLDNLLGATTDGSHPSAAPVTAEPP
jgi:ABC-type branched-subunit amino acid transport system ATPase component